MLPFGGLLTFVQLNKKLIVSKAYVAINRDTYMAKIVTSLTEDSVDMDNVDRISFSFKMDGCIKYIEAIPTHLMTINMIPSKSSKDKPQLSILINCKDLYEHSLGQLQVNNWTKLFYQIFGKTYVGNDVENEGFEL